VTREIELRRHAAREKDADALSEEGRAHAERIGRSLPTDYVAIFVSPARRAAETAAWFLRGSRQQLPDHAVIPGLGSEQEDQWRAAAKEAGSSRLDAIQTQAPELVAMESRRLGAVVAELIDRIPEGGRGLAVGHSPLIEAAVFGLTGAIVEPLGECEGVGLSRDDQGAYRIRELRDSG
jgi:broad specificity phosphatase PhoE